jgi:asparagine synthase (glutamine-hydrolysing)
MISGYYNIAGVPSPIPAFFSSYDKVAGIRFFPVEAEGFSGGFMLHERLPVRESDVCHNDHQNDLLVLFSGYIYNRKELAGHFGFDAGDTEALMAARMFMQEGPAFVSRLNGDFAIFICRPAGRKAYLFRDQAGIRPMAWSLLDGGLAFSTDTRELCRVAGAGRGPDRRFLTGFFRYIDYTVTPCNRVKRLLPGHYLEYSEEGTRVTQYWDPARIATDRSLRHDKVLSDLRSLLEDAVTIRCDSRFTAGAHVSGGLDSGMVAVLARRRYAQQSSFPGYSWSPAEYEAGEIPYDEREMVRSICATAGMTPVFQEITPGAFLRHIERFYYNGGFFIEEGLAAQAAANGTNLIFSGWGGDEFISTGDRGIETDLLRGLKLAAYFRRNPVRPLRRFVKYFLEYTLYPALGILSPAVARSFARDAMYLREPYRKSEREALRNFYFHTSRRQMHLRYLRFYHLQDRCETWTTMGFRLGTEYRYPLLDRRIIEYMISVPSVVLSAPGRFRPLARELAKDMLPEAVVLNNNKKDHLYSAWGEEMMKKTALSVAGEADLWRENPDLGFIDFPLLESDITRYGTDPDGVDSRALIRALVYIKAVHHFSLACRGE